MTHPIVGIVLFVAALAAPTVAARAAPVEAVKTPFAAARYDEAARVVRFTPVVSVDWEKVARRNFRRFDIDHPPPKVAEYLREHIFEPGGDASVATRAPLEPAIPRGTYSLISTAGILPIKPAKLEVSIQFRFDQSKPQKMLAERGFSGEVLSRRIGSGGGGGIVFWSRGHERPVRIPDARVELRQEGERMVLSYADERSQASRDVPPELASKFIGAYGLVIAGQRFLFVTWPPDTVGSDGYCAYRFTLYTVSEKLEDVAGSYYGCDV